MKKFIAECAFGTDYSIATARSLYCVNIPVNKKIMEYVVDKTNNLNDSYKNSKGTKYRGIIRQGKKKDNHKS